MSRTAVYNTTVTWKGEHWGHIAMGNGPEMDFSAPPDAQGHPGVLTPEDAFVAAATKASSGVSTPGCPCASGGAEKSISGPLPNLTWPQCSPFQATVV